MTYACHSVTGKHVGYLFVLYLKEWNLEVQQLHANNVFIKEEDLVNQKILTIF